MLNLINHEADTEKIYLYAEDKAKYQLIIKKRESTVLKYLNDSKAFIEYSNYMDDIYNNIEECNPNKKRNLIVFDDMIADMLSNIKLIPIVTKLFIRGRKLNITQPYFAVPKNIRLNSAHYFGMKIPNKREFQQAAFNHS